MATTTTTTAIVGVLALQGSFNEHIAALRRLGVKGVEVRKPEHLVNLGALIIPGEESTTMAKLAEHHNLVCTTDSPPPSHRTINYHGRLIA